MNPMQAAQNRTARLVREAATPVYSTATPSAVARHAARMVAAEDAGCTRDYCFICSRATDHFGEHSEDQILAFAQSGLGKRFIAQRAGR